MAGKCKGNITSNWDEVSKLLFDQVGIPRMVRDGDTGQLALSHADVSFKSVQYINNLINK